MSMYRYEIWTKYIGPVGLDDKDHEPKLWVTKHTLKEVAQFLDLSVNQVRERMSWSKNGKLGNVWHVRYGSFGYQIIRFYNK